MVRRKLDETLAELHEQLTSADDLLPEQLEQLRSTIQEIEATLNASINEGHDRSVEADGSIVDRLRRATAQIEQSHPTITATVGRIADLLSQLGI